jgi:hypothetical protein
MEETKDAAALRRDCYTCRADADGLSINPGPKPITLDRPKRAMILIGGLDEEVAQRILDEEGV